MKSVPHTTNFLPAKTNDQVICGKTIVEWAYAVVYVHNKQNPREPPTHLHFTFFGSGDYYLEEVVTFVDQWTYFRGECVHAYTHEDHEFRRAKKMACQIVGTYRRKYLDTHGGPPNPLLLQRTLDENLVLRKTNKINKRAQERNTQQFEFKFNQPDTPH